MPRPFPFNVRPPPFSNARCHLRFSVEVPSVANRHKHFLELSFSLISKFVTLNTSTENRKWQCVAEKGCNHTMKGHGHDIIFTIFNLDKLATLMEEVSE